MLPMLRMAIILTLTVFAVAAMAEDAKTEENKPPLVLEAGKYSYTFAQPAGWGASAEEAQRLKVPLMLYPEGRSFTQTGSIVFIDEYCKTPCQDLAQPVRSILAFANTRDPQSKAQSLPAMRTKDGSPIELKVIDSTVNQRPVREAFAFIQNPGSTLVMARLAVGDVASWDKDFKAFASALSSFQFFDCSSDKARGSGMCGPEPEVEIHPNSFDGRAFAARQLYKTPDGERYRQLVNRYLAAYHSRTMRQCFDATADPWTANFELIGFVRTSGAVISVVVQPETNIAKCFATGLLNSLFPAPPKLEEGDLYPIYLEVRLQP